MWLISKFPDVEFTFLYFDPKINLSPFFLQFLSLKDRIDVVIWCLMAWQQFMTIQKGKAPIEYIEVYVFYLLVGYDFPPL